MVKDHLFKTETKPHLSRTNNPTSSVPPQLAMALKQSGLYTHLSAQQAAVAVAAAAAEAARASANGQVAGQSSTHSSSMAQTRLPVNLSSLTPVPRSQLHLDIGGGGGGGGRGSSVEQERESMAARVNEAAMMQVREVCRLVVELV